MASRVVVKGLPPRLYNEQTLRSAFQNIGTITDVSLPALKQGKKTGVAFVGFVDADSASEAVKKRNATFIGTTRIWVTLVGAENDKPKNSRKRQHSESGEPEIAESKPDESEVLEKIKTTGRVLLTGLPTCCTDDHLRDLCQKHETSETRCLVDIKTGDCLGRGYVTFVKKSAAAKFFKNHNGKLFLGRYLKVLPSDERAEAHPPPSSTRNQPTPYVAKSAQDHGPKSWNAFFFGGDVVADLVSRQLELQKSQIVLSENRQLPPVVALALAEARLLREMREFLREAGVNLTCFALDSQRSRTVVVAKNLAPEVDAAELRKLFGRFGPMRRIIFNESIGLTAIVEYVHEEGARRAFERLGTSTLRRRPLKLEMAPASVFEPASDRELFETDLVRRLVKLREGISVPELLASTWLVRFRLPQDEGEYALDGLVPRREKGQVIAGGFLLDHQPQTAYLFFSSPTDASRILVDVQNLASHAEVDTVSIATPEAVISGQRSVPSTLVVRNLPFTATKKEVTALMEAIGPVQDIRLPEAIGGRSRGFGFVNFVSLADTHKALSDLEGVHLAGRRLVLELSRASKETIKEGKVFEKRQKKVKRHNIAEALSSDR